MSNDTPKGWTNIDTTLYMNVPDAVWDTLVTGDRVTFTYCKNDGTPPTAREGWVDRVRPGSLTLKLDGDRGFKSFSRNKIQGLWVTTGVA
jgi:hypothetical protein